MLQLLGTSSSVRVYSYSCYLQDEVYRVFLIEEQSRVRQSEIKPAIQNPESESKEQ